MRPIQQTPAHSEQNALRDNARAQLLSHLAVIFAAAPGMRFCAQHRDNVIRHVCQREKQSNGRVPLLFAIAPHSLRVMMVAFDVVAAQREQESVIFGLPFKVR